MEKSYKQAVANHIAKMCFTPIDEETELQFRSLKCINQFKQMGFVKRQDFISAVFQQYPEMETIEHYKTLAAFWSLRYFKEDVLEPLEILAENLKEEA